MSGNNKKIYLEHTFPEMKFGNDCKCEICDIIYYKWYASFKYDDFGNISKISCLTKDEKIIKDIIE